MSARPAPVMDRDSQPWWAALARHEFVLPRCASCAAWRFPPRAMCNRCGSFGWSWQPPSGTAAVASWVVTHHAFLPGFTAPYVVLTARLVEQDDLLIPGGYDERSDGGALRIGAPLAAGFEDVETDLGRCTLLNWRLTR